MLTDYVLAPLNVESIENIIKAWVVDVEIYDLLLGLFWLRRVHCNLHYGAGSVTTWWCEGSSSEDSFTGCCFFLVRDSLSCFSRTSRMSSLRVLAIPRIGSGKFGPFCAAISCTLLVLVVPCLRWSTIVFSGRLLRLTSLWDRGCFGCLGVLLISPSCALPLPSSKGHRAC